MNKQELGKLGEEEAIKWLVHKDMEIINQNWRSSHQEIDIVARDGKRVIFIEVKTRSSEWYDNPEDAVNASKQKAMLKAARAWCVIHDFDGPVRFDIISILFNSAGKKLIHIPDAFYPMGDLD